MTKNTITDISVLLYSVPIELIFHKEARKTKFAELKDIIENKK